MTIGAEPLISQDFLAELAQVPRYQTPWHGYRDMYRRLLQMYQLWHEDRMSSAHGIEARVPFLDHRLVELTYEVPVELHHDLFWDKTFCAKPCVTVWEIISASVPRRHFSSAKT